MTIANRLARVALEAARAPDYESLRTRLLWNLTVAHGVHDEGGRFASAAGPLRGSGPSGLAFQLAVDMHARTQDDFYPAGRVHIGATVIPAVLAVGTDDVIGAIAAGYEVMALVSKAYSPVAQASGFRPTGVFGPVGAAAAAGVAVGLDEERLAECLSVATVASAGTNQPWVDGSDEWLLELGAAARAGVEAAHLVAGGWRGAPRGFEGAAGWARAFFGDDGATTLGQCLEDYEPPLTPLVALKRHPVSGIAQAPVAAAIRARESIGDRTPTGASIRMSRMECNYPGTGNRGPFSSRSDALMSVPRSVTLAILYGTVSYRDVARPLAAVEQELLDCIVLVPADELGESEVTVSIDTADGEVAVDLNAGEILYPSWSELRSDLSSVAAVCEADVEVVDRIAGLVETRASSDDFLALWSQKMTR